jgi:hypothetical protein
VSPTHLAPPLLLLPLRLEYRLVKRAKPPRLVLRNPDVLRLQNLRMKLNATRGKEGAETDSLREEITDLLAKLQDTPLATKDASLEAEEELWVRWFPDDNFAETGIAPPSQHEKEALDRFAAHPFSRHWPKIFDNEADPALAEMRALWAELEAIAGPARAVHLYRTRNAAANDAWEDRIGRITGLPKSVTLYARNRGKLVPLGTGATIPAHDDEEKQVSFNPDALADGNWLTDFETALARGMGLKVRDPDLVKAARDADWIIATGTSSDDAGALTALFEDQTAAGLFEVMSPDTATNTIAGIDAGGADGDSVARRLFARTEKELGALQADDRDGPRLSEALGLGLPVFDEAPGGVTATHREAAAMIRLIGPAILDGSAEATNTLNGLEDLDLIELLAQHVQATGLFPSLQFGDGAYGLLPVSAAPKSGPISADWSPGERKFEDFVRTYAHGVGRLLSIISGNVTPRLEPEDPDAAEKMLDVLQSSRVSRRLDVSDEGSEDVAGLGCPLVAGPSDADQPSAYFLKILRDPLETLEPADESDRTTPLLARLAVLSLRRIRLLEILKGTGHVAGRGRLEDITGNWRAGLGSVETQAINQSMAISLRRFGNAKPADVNMIPQDRLGDIKDANAHFADAVRQLRGLPGGPERLETLMLATFDLFQHRLDAWITGLASIRLHHLRQTSKVQGLALGYYGFLGALRDEGDSGPADGYLQAPSLAQAQTAAVLRSAYQRGREDGAFEIDLSAQRTRRALKIIDHLRRGVSLPECLGMRGERWLREQGQSDVIDDLRDAFPIRNADADGKGTPGRGGYRTFDGLALAGTPPAQLDARQREVRTVLSGDLDALSDVVMAEAVHHRTGGSAETAAAWLRVLSGGPIPERPDFLRAARSGHASDYRVTLVLPPVSDPDAGPALRLAEPGLAAHFDRRYGQIVTTPFRAQILLGGEPVYSAKLTLADSLGLPAVGAARMGEAAVRTALEREIASRFAAEASKEARAMIADRDGLHAAGAVIEVDLQPIAAGLAEASDFWALTQAAHPLGAGDLSNAADPAHPLTEVVHVAALATASGELWERAGRLKTWLADRHHDLIEQAKSVFNAIEAHYLRPGHGWGDREEADIALSERVRALHRALLPFIGHGFSDTIKLHAAPRLVADMAGEQAGVIAVANAVRARHAALEAALSRRAAAPVTLTDARADHAAAVESIRLATGMPQLSVFPVFTKEAETTPALAPARSPITALDVWPRYRRKLDRLLAHLPSTARAFPVLQSATADDLDAEDRDRRPEELAPRSYHFGVFLGDQPDIAAGQISGIVIDEWGEVRPSRQQQAAMALNYDAPQAEAPNCLLLCVPSQPAQRTWTAATAADHVMEAIELMKMRALTTQTTPLHDTILPNANRLPPVGARPRLPVMKYTGGLRDWFEPMGHFRAVADGDLSGQNWLKAGPVRRFGRNDP